MSSRLLRSTTLIALTLFVSTAHAGRWQRIRGKVASGALLGLIDVATRVGNKLPFARASRFGVRVEKNLRYGSNARNRIDVYHPDASFGPGPHKTLIYIHGGGFTALSKETPHTVALEYAKQGYTVFNVDYRLAPEHPFPAAHEDAFKAYEWIVKHADKFGGDVTKIALAGESAGANIGASIVNATTERMDDPAAQRLYDLGVVPKAFIPNAGHLQVKDAERYDHVKGANWYARDRVKDVEASLYGKSTRGPSERELAEPLLRVEKMAASGLMPSRQQPKTFVVVGSKDPLIGDSHRYVDAMRKQGADVQIKVYEGEGHAFALMPWKRNAKIAKSDMIDFTTHALDD